MINDPPGMNRPDWITMEGYLKALVDQYGTDIKITLDGEGIHITGGDIVDYSRDIVIELRVISHLLNEGLNAKEDLDMLRNDYELELGG
jgi:hypothetical protein